MRFNSYIVELKHRGTSLTGNLLISEKTVSANFKKIAQDLFVAQFKNQVEFSFLEKIEFKNRDKEITVLMPVISKYNKRKLTKLSKILNKPEGREKFNILLNLTLIDKFVKIDELLHFFSINRGKILDLLVEKELQKEIKIINFSQLAVTSFENFQKYLEQLNSIFTECYTGGIQALKFSEIESKIKVPQSSLFFKYLVHTFTNRFSFKIKKDKIVFKKLALSENEKESMKEILEILKKNKFYIFSIENILELSDLAYKEVNDTLWFLVESGEVVQLNAKYFIFRNELDKILNRLKKYKRNQGEMIDIQAFRDLTLFTRKYIIVLFEYFDAQEITRRVENRRQILLVA